LRPLETGLLFALMLLGPSVSGLILTTVLDGLLARHRTGMAGLLLGLIWRSNTYLSISRYNFAAMGMGSGSDARQLHKMAPRSLPRDVLDPERVLAIGVCDHALVGGRPRFAKIFAGRRGP
jgi:hypothetical protein